MGPEQNLRIFEYILTLSSQNTKTSAPSEITNLVCVV